MLYFTRTLRLALCASTVFTLATKAQAQTSSAINLNLGSVVANGGQTGGVITPSGTGTLAQAQKLKQLAPNIVSIRPQSQIQKNPDVNLADAFARVPGVSLVSDSGEGEFINIRGMDADLNGTTFDGIHLTANVQATPSGGERAVDLSAFPAGMVGGVEVTKSLTPDMDAEGLGGSANILPISLPDDGQPLANITLGSGEETLRHTGIFQGNFQLGDRFNIPGVRDFTNSKPFSVIIAYSYYSDRRGIDDVEEDYDPATITGGGNNADLDDLQMRYYQEHRVRQGFFAQFGFDPSPQTGIFLRAMQGGYGVDIAKDRLEFANTDAPNATGPNGAIGSNGDFTVSGVKPQARYTFQDEKVATDLLELGGHTVVANAVNVNGTLSYTQGSDVLPYDYVSEFKGPKIKLKYNVTNPAYRTYSVLSDVDVTDASIYNLAAGDLTNTPQRSFDQEWAAALNGAIANSFLGLIGEAKFGGQIRLRSEGDKQSNFENATDGINLGDVDGTNPTIGYYNSHYVLPPFPAYDELLPQAGMEGTTPDMIQANLDGFQHNSENVYAIYVQETAQRGPWQALVGVRMEDTNGTYRAYAQDNNGNIAPGGPQNINRQDYINFFPSAQLKYSFDNGIQLRGVYSTAIARPGFQQISAATSVSAGGAPNGDNLVTIGNPNLKPTYGQSFDAVVEYYGPHETELSADAFYKLFQNYIFQTQSYGTYQDQAAELSSWKNESGAYARGLELDVQQPLYFLPGLLDGFRLDGNITFVDSHGHSDGPDFKAYQLPETSPITANGELDYEKGPFAANVSVDYVGRSLFAVVNPATNGFTDLNPRDADNFTQARTTMDANIFYAVTPRATLYLQARNLTNSPLEFTQSSSSQYPIQREFYDADWLVGVRFKLGG